jgi:hypothetical protein
VNRAIPSESASAKTSATPHGPASVLERVTAVVLCAVIMSLAWMVSVAYQPDYFRFCSIEGEIIIILGLLMAALVLVSVVALRHTHLPEGEKE